MTGRPATNATTSATATAARVWALAIAVVVVAALAIQLALILTGGPDPNTGDTVASVGVETRMIQTLSFFTIQSNLLVLAVSVALVANPTRDGRLWRVLRLDALLGITVTGLVFDLVLIDYVDPSGWQLVATIGLHYIAPWGTVLGWLLFGPWRRLDLRTVALALLWPIAWIVYTFVRGAIVHWYPYPFVDVDALGYAVALRNTSLVLALACVLLAIFWAIDRVRSHHPRTPYLVAGGGLALVLATTGTVLTDPTHAAARTTPEVGAACETDAAGTL
jgi:hypothetical protein